MLLCCKFQTAHQSVLTKHARRPYLLPVVWIISGFFFNFFFWVVQNTFCCSWVPSCLPKAPQVLCCCYCCFFVYFYLFSLHKEFSETGLSFPRCYVWNRYLGTIMSLIWIITPYLMHNATSNSDSFSSFFERISSNMFLTVFFSPARDGHICGSLVLIVTQRHFSSANLQSNWLPSVRDEGGQVLFL